MLFEEEILSTN